VAATTTALALVPAARRKLSASEKQAKNDLLATAYGPLLVEKAAVPAAPRVDLAPNMHVRKFIEGRIEVLASGMVLNMNIVLIGTEKGSHSEAGNGHIPPVVKICVNG
jgi:hypothetical protein